MANACCVSIVILPNKIKEFFLHWAEKQWTLVMFSMCHVVYQSVHRHFPSPQLVMESGRKCKLRRKEFTKGQLAQFRKLRKEQKQEEKEKKEWSSRGGGNDDNTSQSTSKCTPQQ